MQIQLDGKENLFKQPNLYTTYPDVNDGNSKYADLFPSKTIEILTGALVNR